MTTGSAQPADFPRRSMAHVGYVVNDIRKAIDLWIRTFGAGPFFMEENVVFDGAVQGDRLLMFEHKNAFAPWGNIGVELWEMDRMEPESAFGPRFAPENALNHVAYYVDDIPAESERLESEGLPLILSWTNGEMELRLHDAPELGHMIELLVETDAVIRFRKAIMRAAENWDGSNPIRSFEDVEDV